MKTVLCIDSSGRRYFQRRGGQWRPATAPAGNDRLWVLVNLPDEALEVIDLPRLHGGDRANYLERRLAGAFPESTFRAAHALAGGLFTPGKVMLSGLTTAKDIVSLLDKLDATVVGLWGVAALLTIMAKRFATPDVMLILPSALALRILVVKDRIPVLTRYVQCDGEGTADEILLTRQYLENQRVFERGKPPPVLFLGDASAVAPRLANAGLTLLPVPRTFSSKGDAEWLHPFLNLLVSSPCCQLAPLPLRARYLVKNLRWAAYAGVVASLSVGGYFGQADLRAIIALHGRSQALRAEAHNAASERARLSALIEKSGADPALVRSATQFEAREITAAPTDEAFLPLAAAAIADVPEARLRALAFRLAADGESVCQEREADGNRPGVGQTAPSAEDTASALPRQAEVKLTVVLPIDLSPRAKTEARMHIATALRGMAGVKLIQDPGLAARKATLTGGAGTATGQAEEHWCLSVPWKTDKGLASLPAGKGAL